MSCSHLHDFLQTEISIIEEHIDRHKWFNHIEDKELAVEDFIAKYGGIIRSCYCGYICPMRFDCLLSIQYHNVCPLSSGCNIKKE